MLEDINSALPNETKKSKVTCGDGCMDCLTTQTHCLEVPQWKSPFWLRTYDIKEFETKSGLVIVESTELKQSLPSLK